MRNSLIDGEPKIEMDDTTNLSKYYKKPSNTIPAETTTIETMSFFFFFFFLTHLVYLSRFQMSGSTVFHLN